MRDPLPELLDRLERQAPRSFGADIDDAHRVLLGPASEAAKRLALLGWIRRHQPCVFAKIAARAQAQPALDLCWVGDEDLDQGADHVGRLLQQARRRWKNRAAAGLTSSLQVMFNSERLALARPSPEFVEVCLLLVGCYLPEWQPVGVDTICLDGLPLRRPDGRLELFAASMTTFFTGAHRTRAHDHRVPGGVLLNVNAVGHHTWAGFDAGQDRSVAEALGRSHRTALRSVGNGGIGHPQRRGSTWHLPRQEHPDAAARPAGHGHCRRPAPRPGYLPPDADPIRYGARYHIDVTVSSLYADPAEDAPATGDRPGAPVDGEWTMMLDYFATAEVPDYHNPALMHGLPISDDEAYRAPWAPELRPPTVRRF